MDKKHRFTLHVNMDDFIPATDEEKSYIVQMRPSTTFFKDGVKRLCRNKVALVSLIVVAIITLSAILIPAFWPYSYDQQLGVRPGKPVDASFNNLAPFEYGKTSSSASKRVKRSSRMSSAPTPPGATTSSASSTARAFPSPSASSRASSC